MNSRRRIILDWDVYFESMGLMEIEYLGCQTASVL